MVQCIINIILPIISSVVQPGQPSVSLCAGGWWCVGRGRYSGAAAQWPAVPASVVDWDWSHHNHDAQAAHPRPHSSGACPGGAQQL